MSDVYVSDDYGFLQTTSLRLDGAEAVIELLDALALGEEMRYGNTADASDRREAANIIRALLQHIQKPVQFVAVATDGKSALVWPCPTCDASPMDYCGCSEREVPVQ